MQSGIIGTNLRYSHRSTLYTRLFRLNLNLGGGSASQSELSTNMNINANPIANERSICFVYSINFIPRVKHRHLWSFVSIDKWNTMHAIVVL